MSTPHRMNYKRSHGNTSVQDVPRARRPNYESIVIAPSLAKGRYFWGIQTATDKGDSHITMGNNGELRISTDTPNSDFAPNVFGLERGSQAGQYIIYTYGMISNNTTTLNALTIKKVGEEWRLNYGLYDKDNTHEYEWNFNYHNNAFAITWCGNRNTSGKDFVLHLDKDELILNTYQELLPQHFISNFHLM